MTAVGEGNSTATPLLETNARIKQEPRDWTEWTNAEWAQATSGLINEQSIKLDITELKKEIKIEPKDQGDSNSTEKRDGSYSGFPPKKKIDANQISMPKPLKNRKRRRKRLPPALALALCSDPERQNNPMPSYDIQTQQYKKRFFKQKRPLWSPKSYQNYTDKKVHILDIWDLPLTWTETEVKILLKDCDASSILKVSMENAKLSKKRLRIQFKDKKSCLAARAKLYDVKILGEKLKMRCHFIVDDDTSSDFDSDCYEPEAKRKKKQKVWRPDVDVYEKDPSGLYGLTPEFLKSLNITQPIDQWVHVSSFRCSKAELKEVLDLAGVVLICNMHHNPKSANVMYRHPLEAVQAVSMLNNQMLYGLQLKVSMEFNPPLDCQLPYGLNCIGPGLGVYGKPLRDVVRHYERYLKRQTNSVDQTAFQPLQKVLPDSNSDDSSHLFDESTQDSNTQDSNSFIGKKDRETPASVMETETRIDESQAENEDQDVIMESQDETTPDKENSQDMTVNVDSEDINESRTCNRQDNEENPEDSKEEDEENSENFKALDEGIPSNVQALGNDEETGISKALDEENPGISMALDEEITSNSKALDEENPDNPQALDEEITSNSKAFDEENPGNSQALDKENPGNLEALHEENPDNVEALGTEENAGSPKAVGLESPQLDPNTQSGILYLSDDQSSEPEPSLAVQKDKTPVGSNPESQSPTSFHPSMFEKSNKNIDKDSSEDIECSEKSKMPSALDSASKSLDDFPFEFIDNTRNKYLNSEFMERPSRRMSSKRSLSLRTPDGSISSSFSIVIDSSDSDSDSDNNLDNRIKSLSDSLGSSERTIRSASSLSKKDTSGLNKSNSAPNVSGQIPVVSQTPKKILSYFTPNFLKSQAKSHIPVIAPGRPLGQQSVPNMPIRFGGPTPSIVNPFRPNYGLSNQNQMNQIRPMNSGPNFNQMMPGPSGLVRPLNNTFRNPNMGPPSSSFVPGTRSLGGQMSCPNSGPLRMSGPNIGLNMMYAGPISGPRMGGPTGPRTTGPTGPRTTGPTGPRMPGPVGSIRGPMMPGPSISGPYVGPRPNMNMHGGPRMPGPDGPMKMPGPSGPQADLASTTVELSNLPPTTTFPLLSAKMAECGHVTSLRLTTPGCAVVQFANQAQAKQCWQMYNNVCIQGIMVRVKFI